MAALARELREARAEKARLEQEFAAYRKRTKVSSRHCGGGKLLVAFFSPAAAL